MRYRPNAQFLNTLARWQLNRIRNARDFSLQRLCGAAVSRAGELGKRTMEIIPISLAAANEFVAKYHRHHNKVVGHKFSAAASHNGTVVGVVIVGRPVARSLDDGRTLEVTRCCTDGHKNACSFLYGAAWRAARALGYTMVVTYILASEQGSSLRASGYNLVGKVKGRSWSCPSRPRKDKHPTVDKLRYSRALTEKGTGVQHKTTAICSEASAYGTLRQRHIA